MGSKAEDGLAEEGNMIEGAVDVGRRYPRDGHRIWLRYSDGASVCKEPSDDR